MTWCLRKIEVRLKVEWKDGTSDNARSLEELRNAADLDQERRVDDAQGISFRASHLSSERGELELTFYASKAFERYLHGRCEV